MRMRQLGKGHSVMFFAPGEVDCRIRGLIPDGTIEPFISSPFNQQLERCLVYLDDAHTRGTDINFPQGTRAAVTLGQNVTKDRLVQGKTINHIRRKEAN